MAKKVSTDNRQRSMLRYFLIVMLLVTLACALPGSSKPTATLPAAEPPTATLPPTATPQPTPTPQPLPPALIESLPAQGGELPVKGPITLYFNQAMNRSTVETALAGQLPQTVRFDWVDERSVALFPASPFQPDAELSLTLGAPASSAQGLSLLQPISLNFRTAGYLALSQVLPQSGSKDIDPTSAVAAAFNQPVVSLGAEPSTLPAAFTLNPSAQGRGEWINTSTYVFYPEPALAGGVQYTVTPNPALTSTGGSPLKDAEAWSFTTAMPRLVSVTPNTESPWRLDARVELTFNQPMDVASVEAMFSLLDPTGAPVAGTGAWNADATVFTFTPAARLARQATYAVSLDGQAKSLGGAALGTRFDALVITVAPLAVASTDPVPGGVLQNNYGSVSLFFTAPIQAVGLLDLIRITPAVDSLDYYWDEDGQRLYINGIYAANTAYTLTISADLRDVWGETLGSPFVFNFSTPPPAPNLTLLPFSLAQFLRPGESSLQVQATNLNSVPMEVGSLAAQDYFMLSGGGGYDLRETYRSPDEQVWQQALDIIPDRSQVVQLPLTPDGSSLPPGLYYLRIRHSELKGGLIFKLLVVSDIQLTYKVSAQDALVWAVDLRSNTPRANTPVTLFDENGDILAQGSTDRQGIFRASLPASEDPYRMSYAMLGQPGEGAFSLAPSYWSEGVSAGDFGYSSRLRAPGPVAYLYTDRPIYRPGDTVYFRAVVRQENNGRYTLPADMPSLPLKIWDGNGAEIASLALALSAYGTAHGQFTLPAAAQPGEYSLGSRAVLSYDLSFKVANYRKPEINLQVSLSPEQALAGETLQAQINARYFFDAPAGNVPIRWALYAAPAYFSLPGYQVGPQDSGWLDAFHDPLFGGWQSLGVEVQSGEAQTAPDGTLNLELPTEAGAAMQRYTLEVTLTDESGQPVSARAGADVNPADAYIGLRPDAWVGRANEAAGFTVLAVDWYKQPAGVHALRAEFSKVVWQRQDPTSLEPGLQPKYVPQYTPAGSVDFSTGGDGQARLSFTPPQPGTYLLKVFDPQSPEGQGALSELLLWVGGAGQAIWPDLPNSRLRLVADKENYRPGETAQVFIPNPLGQEVLALVTFERQVIMAHQVLSIPAEGLNLPVKLTDEHAPNIYVSVTLLGSNTQGQPDFRQGYLNLPVEAVAQALQVRLTAQPERAGPGEAVTFSVQVTDSSGKPAQGEFSLAVVDLAVLALADPNAPDILPAFYDIQPLGLRTSLSLAASSQRMWYMQLGRGGGGGGDVPAVVRERFPDTAYWNGEIVTDADGKATVTLQLPDTLTTWQVDLRGITLDSRVGQATTQIVTTKTALIRPVTPRFLVFGDRALLAAVVQNNTAAELEAEVSLQAGGFSIESAATQTVSVPAGGRARVEWWGVAQDAASADLVFSFTGQDSSGNTYQDASRPALGALPILRYLARQSFRTSGILDSGGQIMELVSLPHSFAAQGGELAVELAPSLASSMLSALDVLEHSPYESIEETLSRFLPNLETYRTLQSLGLENPQLRERLDRTLADGLLRLSARQNFDGGWGWWNNGESDAYMTAYVLFGLLRAREAGVQVNEDQIIRAVDYLKSNAQFAALRQENGFSQRIFIRLAKLVNLTPLPGGGGGSPLSYDRLVFQEFVLSQAVAGDPARAQDLYQSAEIQAQLNPWSKALLALTLESYSPGSPEAVTLLSDLQSSASRSATGVHWELLSTPAALRAAQYDMHTGLSNSAVVMYALAQRDPGSPLLADALRYLMAHRQADGGWGSSYTTAWTLMAMTQMIQATGELGGDFTFSATLNGTPLLQGQANHSQLTPVTAQTPVGLLYPDYPNALVIQRGAGQGRLYYTVGLRVNRPVQSIAPLSQGMSISRAYYPLPSECTAPCAPLQAARAGSRIQVRLTLTLPQEGFYVMVEDYIPAGAEILDTSLKTSQLGEGGGVQYDLRDPFAGGWGWWLFNPAQIYDDHITFTAAYLQPGTYELTYTLVLLQPGLYQVLPAHAWMYYFPEVQGNSAGTIFEVKK